MDHFYQMGLHDNVPLVQDFFIKDIFMECAHFGLLTHKYIQEHLCTHTYRHIWHVAEDFNVYVIFILIQNYYKHNCILLIQDILDHDHTSLTPTICLRQLYNDR